MNIQSRSAMVLGLAIASIAATAVMANSGTSDMQCGFFSTGQNGMLSLEGTLLSPLAISGTYNFIIQSSSNGSSSNISQGGAFAAKANELTSLGKVMLNSDAHYNVVFDITAGGQTIDCNQEITGQR